MRTLRISLVVLVSWAAVAAADEPTPALLAKEEAALGRVESALATNEQFCARNKAYTEARRVVGVGLAIRPGSQTLEAQRTKLHGKHDDLKKGAEKRVGSRRDGTY